MYRILQIKNWQLFLLTYFLPGMLVLPFPWLVAYFLIAIFGWFWIMGHFLHSRLPAGVRMRLYLFRIFLIFIPVYLVTLVLMINHFVALPKTHEVDPISDLLTFLAWIPVHLFALFCWFYSLYFLAKSLKAVESGRAVKFDDYISEFLTIWIWPIGLWFIVPRVNKIYSEINVEKTNATSHP